MTDQTLDPAEALRLAGAAQRAAVLRGVDAPWYAPLYGLSQGGMVASLALPQPWLIVGVLTAFAVGIGNYAVWRHRKGMSVNNFQGPRTSIVGAILTGLFALAVMASVILRFRFGYELAPLPIGAVMAGLATVGSRLWDRAWLAETREP